MAAQRFPDVSARTASGRRPPRSERVVVLFADVVGSTALADALDPEDVQEIIGTAVAQVVRLIEKSGGTVREIAGDGVLAFFEPGDARDDHADAAVDAGHAIARSVLRYAGRLRMERGLDGFGLRVGIHAGEVVVTPSGDHDHLSGEAIDVATALEGAATPGTLLVSETTARTLVRPRAWSGSLVVGTASGPVSAHVLAPTDHDVATPPFRDRGSTPNPPPVASHGIREERKVVTALFVRVRTSDGGGDVTSEEAIVALERAVDVIERYGGTVKDRAGGSVVAVFGMPRAREDDAERAVRASIEIIGHVRSDTVMLSAGITTGLVVITPLERGTRVEYGVTGDTMNTAARLHVAAEPGTVLVGERTHRLVSRSFVFGPSRELVLKGKARPVVAYPAVRPIAEVGLRSHATAMVGRERERRILTEVAASDHGLLLVEGDAGLGKSRLLAELRRLTSGRTWLESRCQSFATDDAYGPLRQLVLGALGLEIDATPTAVRETVDGVAAGAADRRAFLALAAGIEPNVDEQRVLGPLGPATVHSRIAEVLDGLFEAVAPVVVAVEDVHWASQPTVAVLDELAGARGSTPVLFALTRRPDPQHASVRLVDRVALGGRHLELAPMTTDEQHELLTSLVGQGVLPLEIERRIFDAAAGNPFFVEELLGSLQDLGRLVKRPSGWRFVGDLDLVLPDTVERVLLSRIDQLQPLARTVLDSAAVVGRDFTPDVVATVADLDADLDTALGTLVDAGFVEPVPGRHFYTFRHSLVQETAYRRLLRRHRSVLHRRAAEALAIRGAEDGVLARHWWLGGEALAALEHAHRAGQAARRSSDPEGAVDHLALALEAAAVVDVPATERLELLTDLGDVARTAGRLSEAMTWLEEAAALARDLGDVPALARAAVGLEDATYASRRPREDDEHASLEVLRLTVEKLPDSHPMHVPVLARLAQALSFGADEAEAREIADLALGLARSEGSPGALAQALLAWRMPRQGPTWLDERLSVIDETVAAADAAGDPDVALEAARLRVMDLLVRGDVPAADRAIADARRRIEELRQPQYRWYPAMWDAMRVLLAGDIALCEEAIERFREVGRRFRFGGTIAVYGLQLFLLRREQGRALEVTELATRLADEIGPAWEPTVAALAIEAGKTTEAAELVAALTGPRRHELPRDLGYPVRLALLAEVAAATGDGRAAAHLYRELLPYDGCAIVVGAGAVCLGAASFHLGLLARVLGHRRRAQAHLEESLAQNTMMGARIAAGYAACELVALGTEPPARRAAMLREHEAVAEQHGLARLRDRISTLERQLDKETHNARLDTGT